MALCDRCINKGNCGAQEFFEEGKLLLSHCRNFVGEKPREIKTNFQRITASPESLAEFLGEYAMPPCGHIVLCKECPLNGKSCLDDNVATDKDAWLEWLKQESK